MMNKRSKSCSRRVALRRFGSTVALAAIGGGFLPAMVRADSLWVAGQATAMVSDKRAVRAGDILHILVQENNSTSKNNNTSTKKSSDVDAKLATFLYSPAASKFMTKAGEMPALKFNSSYGFDGGGKIENSEKIVARVAVVVVDVLPNNNLVIEGRRQTSFSGETQDIILRGLVRPADIAANNSVYSYNVADASIKFVSKGVVTDSQRKGWFQRIWEKVTPF
jgi:flagellar L-ring protein FlgH